MLIAIDYDGTYAADKNTFKSIIRCFQSVNHEVCIVTMRSPTLDYHPDFDELKDKYDVRVVFCDGVPKRKHCESVNLFFDIWIDDHPESIYLGSQFTDEQLSDWRKNRAA